MRLHVLGWGGMNKDYEVPLVFRLLQPPLSKTFFFSSLFSMAWAPVLFPLFLFKAWTIPSVHRRTGAWVGGYVGPSGTRDAWYLSPFPGLPYIGWDKSGRHGEALQGGVEAHLAEADIFGCH